MYAIEELRGPERIDECAAAMRRAFGTVAAQFGLTPENAATNPAFVTADGLRRYLEKPVRLFVLLVDDRVAGCVAVERSKDDEGTWYLERLAVVPEARHHGYGALLVSHALELIRQAGGTAVSIGLMNDNAVLKRWYERQGFVETTRRRYPHLPFEVCFMLRPVSPGGEGLFAEERGSGRAVLLVHAGVADCGMWDEGFALLAERCRAIRCDLRGWGRSPAPPRPYAHHAEVAALLDRLGVDRCVLVGASFGGAVAIDTALACPERVEALVLAAPAVSGWEPSSRLLREFIADEERALDQGDLDGATELNLRLWVDGPSASPTRIPAELRDRVRVMQRRAFGLGRPAGAREVPLEPPAVGRLGEIGVPSVVIVGALDVPEFRDLARRVATSIPAARLVEVPDAAHLVPLEKPAWFDGTVRSFLAGLP